MAKVHSHDGESGQIELDIPKSFINFLLVVTMLSAIGFLGWNAWYSYKRDLKFDESQAALAEKFANTKHDVIVAVAPLVSDNGDESPAL